MRASCAPHTLRSFANMQQWFGGCACLQLVALTPLRRELGEIFRVGVDQLAQPLLLLRLGLRFFLGRHITVLDPGDDRSPQIHILDQRLGIQCSFEINLTLSPISIVAIETEIFNQVNAGNLRSHTLDQA